MEGSPRKNMERPEKGYKDTSLQKKEDENDYSQQGIICGELPLPINGDLLKEILHRSVGALKFLNKYKQPRAGSGVLISRDTILTAAHNIYDRDEDCKCENEDFKFYIGADGEAREYYEIEEKCWRFPEEYKTCLKKNKLHFDFAIMKLKKPIQFDKYMSLSLACEECLRRDNKKLMLEIYGFPASYRDNYQPVNPQDKYKKIIKLNQYGIADKNRIFDINASQLKICYGISTLPGQSGCPVVVDNHIIAVHVGDSSKFNVGRIIDASFMNSIWKWREELNAAPFSLKEEQVCPHAEQTLEKMRYKLKINFKGLKNVDLREYGDLLELNLSDNKLRQIDLAHCPRLTRLYLGSNQLQRIDIANNKHLTYLYLWSNQLQEVDVRANVNLTHLNLSSNRIAEIDLTKNTKLEQLQLQMNMLARVRLWIAEKVREDSYTGSYWAGFLFNLSHQLSAACRLQLMCEAQTKFKAARIAKKWKGRYENPKNNWKKCSYHFEVV